MKILLSAVLFLILLSSAQSKTPPNLNFENSSYAGFPNTLKGKDFFVLHTNSTILDFEE